MNPPISAGSATPETPAPATPGAAVISGGSSVTSGAARRPVVLIAEELSDATLDVLGDDFEIRHCDGADRSALLPALADVDALLVRSATKVDAEALTAARRLKVVARAGVGLDNVDVRAATQAGVMVVNAPQSNIISAAEHAIALLLAVARRVPAADASLRAGEWKRSKFGGVELYDKTLGVLGLGRIGVLVAQRLAAFGMKVVAYDPYVQPGRAAQMGVRLVPLEELLEVADAITVHLPKTPETLGLVGEAQLATMKPDALVVNAARGGIIDEHALYVALKEGRLGGAGIDVFTTEPCTDSPLLELPNVVATPHLGASTAEAQEKAGVAVARSVRLALAGELVPDAVNVQGGVIAEDVRPGIPLAEKLGRIFTALAGEVAVQMDVEVRGEITDHDVKVLELAALKGVFASVVEEQVSYVNVPLLAAERGLEVRLRTDPESPDFRNLVTLRGTLADGRQVSVGGTLVGPRHIERLVEVEGFDIEIELTSHMAVLRYVDRPGVVGIVGRILGAAGVNIAGMQVSRDRRGGEALAAMTVDSTIPQAALDEIAQEISAEGVRAIDLDD
ncbi:D-3-phosphoglycerate dehydrogenase [Actinopolymorpha cephalotaxi]|uniref:D-3-phosphoglycerate dehydrogenase n=1 Tax=Actinopolymorpha cephalotaxi TaxID=504797 RepID=A0A1I3AHS6_9ACTN|nr:D-3-phosphoglycerate dehydrogenase [Actinopolymorpha cephalotaxi]